MLASVTIEMGVKKQSIVCKTPHLLNGTPLAVIRNFSKFHRMSLTLIGDQKNFFISPMTGLTYGNDSYGEQ